MYLTQTAPWLGVHSNELRNGKNEYFHKCWF